MTKRSMPSVRETDGFFPEADLQQHFAQGSPTCWAAQTTDEHQALLEDLDVWVTWLVEHYSLDRRHVPECWAQHWELIEELSALRQAWEGAYATTAHADAPLVWHERFQEARLRLAEWVARTGCRKAEHRPSP